MSATTAESKGWIAAWMRLLSSVDATKIAMVMFGAA